MRGFVFIDGSNFYFKLKRLIDDGSGSPPLSSFNFKAFSEWLVGPHELTGVRYYIGAIKQGSDEKSRRLYADQQRLSGR